MLKTYKSPKTHKISKISKKEHLQLETCTSTQHLLREQWQMRDTTYRLVSTKAQIGGHGRRGRQWFQWGPSLALSFIYELMPAPFTLLTPLKIGLLLRKWIQMQFNHECKLKWPNDLMNEDAKKCGGIIIDMLEGKKCVVGIGLNLAIEEQEYCLQEAKETDAGAILTMNEMRPYLKEDLYAHHLSESLVEYFYCFLDEHELDAHWLKEQWSLHCSHLNQEITVHENDNTADRDQFTGTFEGLGEFGQALVRDKQAGELRSFLNGTIRSSRTR